jgi:hypothetical protein
MIEIIPCGTPAETVVGNIHGQITGITIRFGDVQYELTYVINGEFKNAWLREPELIVTEKKNKIGFRHE